MVGYYVSNLKTTGRQGVTLIHQAQDNIKRILLKHRIVQWSRAAQSPDTSAHRVTKRFTAAPNICGSSVLNVLHVALLEPGIF